MRDSTIPGDTVRILEERLGERMDDVTFSRESNSVRAMGVSAPRP